jgi:adenosine deaminase
MSSAGVMDVVCSRTKEVAEKLGMYAGVIVYVSAVVDDPISFNEMANLAVNYRQNDSMVVGFGIYGDSPIPSDSFRFFKKTFDLLKSHNINIAMVAGIDTVDTIMTAIQEGGASRLSGCFQVHTFPRLMDYMASYGIPVEVSMTEKLRRFTKDASFGGNAIRLLLDNEVPVAICSFRALFQDKNRVEMLEEIIKECHLSIPDTVKLLSTGFNFNFQNSIRQRKILGEFWAETQKVLHDYGVEEMFDVPFFP